MVKITAILAASGGLNLYLVVTIVVALANMNLQDIVEDGSACKCSAGVAPHSSPHPICPLVLGYPARPDYPVIVSRLAG